MSKYNRLTERLLAEGYTAENYPKDKVHIAHHYHDAGDPLDNYYGGFEYNRIYQDGLIYRTGCGMYVIGRNVLSGMGYNREDWCHENDNPVIRCPFDKAECEDNDPRLYGVHGGGLSIQCWCVCHRTDDSYNYEHSFEKHEKERQEEKMRKYEEFVQKRHGRVCERHAHYDERSREWSLVYEPKLCGSICYSQNGFCPMLNKQLDKKKGNVYYDLMTRGINHYAGSQISLFENSEWKNIEKGLKVFNKPVSLDICKAFVKVQKDSILELWKLNHHEALFFDKSLRAEVLNVRAEAKESRDLMQDLQDIRDGYAISHASDTTKEKKEQKKEKKDMAKQKRIEKLEKKLIEVGYQNLPERSLDRVHADKWIDPERLEKLEQIRQQKIREEQEKPVQLSLFDI